MPESIIAAIATLIGVAGLKIVEAIIARFRDRRTDRLDKEAKDEAARQQEILQLRAKIADLEAKMNALNEEVDEWREKYYTVREEHLDKISKMTDFLNQFKEANHVE